MIMENVPASLRGELSRWMIEPKAGVFVGKISATVRDKLWSKALESKKLGYIIQLWSTNNEQGFSARSVGISSSQLVDVDGLTLVKYMNKF